MAGRIRSHQQLNSNQMDLIKKASVTPEDIFAHMDDLNEEIAEEVETDGVLPIPKVDAPTVVGELKTYKLEPTPKEQIMSEIDEDLDSQLAREAAAAEAKLELIQKKQKEAAEKAAEENPQEETEDLSPEEMQRKMIMELIDRHPRAPSHEQIEALKAKYGKNGVHVLALGEDDIYIYTYLRRGQWDQIQKLVQASAAGEVGGDPDRMLQEKVVQYTVLWPKGVSSPEFLTNSRAGVIPTLYQVVLLNSYFLSPQQAMMLTTQL